MALDAPVERYLPGLIRGNGNDGREITVRQLLSHTSGLPDYDSPVYAPNGGYYRHRFDHHTPEELVQSGVSQPRLAVPGTEFHYSTTNYVLAGMIIEEVTGRSYARRGDRAHPAPARPARHRAARRPRQHPGPARPRLRATWTATSSWPAPADAST